MNSDRSGERGPEELCGEVRGAFIQRADGSFDFDAGLADVFARAGLERPAVAAAPASAPAPSTWRLGPGAVAAVCEQADRLTSVLGLFDQRVGPVAFDHLQCARELVFEFRSILSTADQPDPERLAVLLARVGGHLDSADRLVRSQGSASLAEALRARLDDLGPVSVDPCGELEALRGLVVAALQDFPGSSPGRASRRPAARRDLAAGDKHGD
ncbi:hypothetical protein ACEZCY_06615 [Streptacidiphilus sp. N1-12]|uniref:Uncharacterized protein n=2 Tax=Streptacidiphilus alkalitolerans TaxID=3342712 RepID=A0ABV6V5F4_9ACTN